jgi:dCMP deaminase
MNRPSWDVYFARIVENVATRSTCIRHQFGAVIVNEDKEIISTGYNGPVRGAPHCCKKDCNFCSKNVNCDIIDICLPEHRHFQPIEGFVACVKDENNIESGMGHGICPAVHAEQNALLQAGKQARKATLYVNGFPCKICARLMVNAGITRVVVSGEYTDKEGLEILKAANIEVVHVDSREESKPPEVTGAEKESVAE